MSKKYPRVSIGLPVYNGQNYLSDSLDCILGQTFDDLEVVISDNCSTDATERICLEYMARDPRIRYFRNERNIGSARNFARVSLLARGEFFKWASHDDTFALDFVERAVGALDADADAVLCFARTRIVDGEGKPVRDYDEGLRSGSRMRHVRFHDLIVNFKCFEIFGLIRADALRKAPPYQSFGHADGVLLARLGLMGRFVEIPEYLMYNREHASKSEHAYSTYRGYTVWIDPANAGKILLPRWRLLYEYARALAEVPMNVRDRFLCSLQFGHWIRIFWKSLAANLVIAGWEIVCLPFAGRPNLTEKTSAG